MLRTIDGALDNIFKLSDIPRPGVVFHGFAGGSAEGGNRFTAQFQRHADHGRCGAEGQAASPVIRVRGDRHLHRPARDRVARGRAGDLVVPDQGVPEARAREAVRATQDLDPVGFQFPADPPGQAAVDEELDMSNIDMDDDLDMSGLGMEADELDMSLGAIVEELVGVVRRALRYRDLGAEPAEGGETAEKRLEFVLKLSPLELVERGQSLLSGKDWDIVLYLKVAAGFEFPVYLLYEGR